MKPNLDRDGAWWDADRHARREQAYPEQEHSPATPLDCPACPRRVCDMSPADDAPRDVELPGMWESADFLDGAPEVVRGPESAIHDGRCCSGPENGTYPQLRAAPDCPGDHAPAACRPETCGGIHYDPCEPMRVAEQEQREAYAEAILDAAGSTPLGLEFRYMLAEAAAEVEDRHTAALRDVIGRLRAEVTRFAKDAADVQTKWLAAEARAEDFEDRYETAHASRMHAEKCLREREAEVERLRQAYKAWQETSRSVSAIVAHHWRDTKDALKKAEATIAELGGLAQLHATSAHMRGDSEERRRWLDVCAVIARAERADRSKT